MAGDLTCTKQAPSNWSTSLVAFLFDFLDTAFFSVNFLFLDWSESGNSETTTAKGLGH